MSCARADNPTTLGQLVSLFIESFLTGALIFIYAVVVWILLIRDRRNTNRLRRIMFAVATFMLCLSLVVRLSSVFK